jgi:NADH:ubiquinone oxidoreductase subunit F (NADH-binding)
VYCLGKCYAGPASGDDDPKPARAVEARRPVVLERLVSGGARSLDEYRRQGGYLALEAALQTPAEDIIRMIESSGLRGRGGAGFPSGRKWRIVAAQAATPRYVVANGDEGDAGAYVDRFIMEDDPHALIEGTIIAAYAVGAPRGWIYLRCEYPAAKPVLERALEECRAAGLLGPSILGSDFSFDVALHVGRGSYLCGEETALLNSIEGRRPVARVRPPYVAERGLFGRPTLINNVETLANVPWIIRHGPNKYRAMGFSQSRGTKVVCLNSLFNRPGMYEVEFGIPVRRIVEELGGGIRGGGELGGVIIGGPLAGVMPPHLLDTPFGFEELRAIGASVGHGGVVAFDEHTRIPQLVHQVFRFASYESCGKCIPCRLGCRRIEQIFEQVSASPADREEFADIVSTLAMASLCGLGGGAAEFAQSVLRYYAGEP